MELDPCTRTRWKFFLVILAVIAGIHLIVLGYIMRDHVQKKTNPEPPKSETKAPAGTENAPGNAPAAPQNATAPVQTRRFRTPSTNPNFGKLFDFSRARHGNFPEKVVPGSSGAACGIIVDMDTRRVLWEKHSDRRVKIASMTKMMTMLLFFEELDRHPEWSLETVITVPKGVMKVPRTGVVWLTPGEKFTMGEIVMAAAVKSANDAAELLAETVTNGSTEEFVKRMNARAAELGLGRALHFVNPHGLPDKKLGDAEGTPQAMVLLGERLLEYPKLMEYCSMQQGAIREGAKATVFVNTNGLIRIHYPGVDGLKTGFTNASGFCLTFSAVRNNRRVMGCVTGFKTGRDRDRFCRKLIDWAYNEIGKKK